MGTVDWEPDVVVGVDFGMTCTGVAYSLAPDWPDPKAIQHWPGRLGSELQNKVATAVAYDKQTQAPVSWGALADPLNEQTELWEHFKLELDPAYVDDAGDHGDFEGAARAFTDYLKYLYDHIMTLFEETFPRNRQRKVGYLFSTPTTWRSPAIVANIERLIKKAGFGNRPSDRLRMSLTEAEAAAVYASKQRYQKDDVIVACDAGGGTTDINILKIKSTGGERTSLETLSWVEGQAIGSTLIDLKVEKFIMTKLEKIRDHLPGSDLKKVTTRMLCERFEGFKRSFGSAASNLPRLLLPIPGLAPGMDFGHISVYDSKLEITRDELQGIFDIQIQKIFTLLDQQLAILQQRHASEVVSYLVLSGGLGSSPYVKRRLKSRYESGAGGGFANASELQILSAPEPQLAVVMGLVMNRTQEVRSGDDIYSVRCARNSYGVLCREPYDPLKHQGEGVVIDPRNKKRWAERQVHWLIKQGQTISSQKWIENDYRLKLDLGHEHDAWSTQIVMSSLPSSQLPPSMKHDGIRPICALESRLDPSSMKRKNKHWYNLGPQYYRANFKVKITIGAADLKFSLWSKDGQKCSKDHDEIEAQWDSPKKGAVVTQEKEESGMERY